MSSHPSKPGGQTPPPSFAITSREQDGVPIFAFSGYCTAEGGRQAAALVEQVMQAPRRGMVWDFSSCRLINSPGVVALMEVALRVVDDFRCRLVITGVDATQISVFRMAGVFPVADLAPSLEDALLQAGKE